VRTTQGGAVLGIGALIMAIGACGSSTPVTPAPSHRAPTATAPAAPATTAPAAAGAGGEGSDGSTVSEGTGALIAHSGCDFQSTPFTITTPTITMRYTYSGNVATTPEFTVYLTRGDQHWAPADQIVRETGTARSYHVVRQVTSGQYHVTVVSNARTCTVTVVPGGTPGQ
jgi:hypothetical protein